MTQSLTNSMLYGYYATFIHAFVTMHFTHNKCKLHFRDPNYIELGIVLGIVLVNLGQKVHD